MKNISLVFDLAGLVLAGLFLGSILDKILKTQSYFQAGGVVLGFLLWMFFLWKRFRS